MTEWTIELADEEAGNRFAAALGQVLPRQFFYLALEGGLGAGKTHTVRGLLRSWGETGAVRSPSYTLIEEYQLADRRLVHMDLYRLADPEELEFLGVRELIGEPIVLCVEWPQRAGSLLPSPDLLLEIEILVQGGRALRLKANSSAAKQVVHALKGWSAVQDTEI